MESDVASALELVVEGALAGGEHGAFAVRSRRGTRLVLKVFDPSWALRLRRSVEVVGAVRGRGIPVPWPYETGVAGAWAYTLQARCRGVVPPVLSDRHAATMLDLWEAQRGAGLDGEDWPPAVERALRAGEVSLWADHGPIRAAGGRAAGLLDEIVDVGARFDAAALCPGDAVHGDWHHQNLLVEGDAVTAIIDWEASRPGDARSDLAYLAFWADVFDGSEVSPEAAARIRTAAAARVGGSVRPALAALVAVHQLWFTSAHRPDRLPGMVELVDHHLAPWWRS